MGDLKKAINLQQRTLEIEFEEGRFMKKNRWTYIQNNITANSDMSMRNLGIEYKLNIASNSTSRIIRKRLKWDRSH